MRGGARMRFSRVQILGKNMRMDQDPDLDFDPGSPKTSGPGPGPESTGTLSSVLKIKIFCKKFSVTIYFASIISVLPTHL